jgi:chromosome segregation ATPase
MPSPIPEEAVAKAIHDLRAEKIPPTVKQVQDKIGSGSLTAVLPIYQSIMENHWASFKPLLSDEAIAGRITALMTELADEKSREIETRRGEELARNREDMEFLRETLADTEKKNAEMEKTHKSILHDREKISATLESLKEEADGISKDIEEGHNRLNKIKMELNLRQAETENLKQSLAAAKAEEMAAKKDAHEAKEKAAKLEGRLEELEKKTGPDAAEFRPKPLNPAKPSEKTDKAQKKMEQNSKPATPPSPKPKM